MDARSQGRRVVAPSHLHSQRTPVFCPQICNLFLFAPHLTVDDIPVSIAITEASITVE